MNRVAEYTLKYGEYLIVKPSQSGSPRSRAVLTEPSSRGTKDGDYKCAKCNKIWHPTDADINRKAMHTYYKCCGVCRTYLLDKKREAERL